MPAVGITDGPSICARDHRVVVHLARRWAALECRSAWLVVYTQVKVVPEKPTVLGGHVKCTDAMPFKYQIYTPLSSTVIAQHNSAPHTLWGCAGELASALTAATI